MCYIIFWCAGTNVSKVPTASSVLVAEGHIVKKWIIVEGVLHNTQLRDRPIYTFLSRVRRDRNDAPGETGKCIQYAFIELHKWHSDCNIWQSHCEHRKWCLVAFITSGP